MQVVENLDVANDPVKYLKMGVIGDEMCGAADQSTRGDNVIVWVAWNASFNIAGRQFNPYTVTARKEDVSVIDYRFGGGVDGGSV